MSTIFQKQDIYYIPCFFHLIPYIIYIPFFKKNFFFLPFLLPSLPFPKHKNKTKSISSKRKAKTENKYKKRKEKKGKKVKEMRKKRKKENKSACGKRETKKRGKQFCFPLRRNLSPITQGVYFLNCISPYPHCFICHFSFSHAIHTTIICSIHVASCHI